MKLPTAIIAIGMLAGATCATSKMASALEFSAIFENEPRTRTDPDVAFARRAATSPFSGTYCGYFDSRNDGSLSISSAGKVSGYFSSFSPTFSESYRLSGRVNAPGVMKLKVVHTITVRDRGGGTSTQRYSATVIVVLDESGNLVATSGASFELSPCQESQAR